ncbi:type IV pilus modification PilV family protein [Cytobacillus dafuensis]|nr:prepilin-type N-terminal cleavage/methylation domain-containing protein [Cytobacillus dafuensis]
MNQKGITLLEVLLSMLILSIILVSFFSFFSQSAVFIKKNDDKLSAVNTAQMVLNILQENEKKNTLYLPQSVLEDVNSGKSSIITNEMDEFSTLLNQDIQSSFKISLEFKEGYEKLIQVKIMVSDPKNNKNEAKTYTYISR